MVVLEVLHVLDGVMTQLRDGDEFSNPPVPPVPLPRLHMAFTS